MRKMVPHLLAALKSPNENTVMKSVVTIAELIVFDECCKALSTEKLMDRLLEIQNRDELKVENISDYCNIILQRAISFASSTPIASSTAVSSSSPTIFTPTVLQIQSSTQMFTELFKKP